jgi:Trk K+ transport system NAD-binding subunit
MDELPILLAKRLHQTGEQVTLVVLDQRRVRGMSEQNWPVIEGDPRTPAVLEAAGAASAAALIAVSVNDEVNLATCSLAGEMFGVPHLIARGSDPHIAAQMTERGVRVIQPQLATVLALEGALHFPAAFDVLANHADGVEIREVELHNPRLDGQPLRHIHLPGDALVLGLRRDGEILVPHGETKLSRGDWLMLIGHQDCIEQAMAQLG